MKDLFKLLFVGLFAAFLILVGPWCFLWAINVLVQAGGIVGFVIPFTFKTWLAALIVGGLSIIPRVRRGN